LFASCIFIWTNKDDDDDDDDVMVKTQRKRLNSLKQRLYKRFCFNDGFILCSLQDWYSRQKFLILVLALNVSLAAVFWHLLTTSWYSWQSISLCHSDRQLANWLSVCQLSRNWQFCKMACRNYCHIDKFSK